MYSSEARQRRTARHSTDGGSRNADGASRLPLTTHHNINPASPTRRRRRRHAPIMLCDKLHAVTWPLLIVFIISSILFVLDKVFVHHYFLSTYPNYQKLAAATSSSLQQQSIALDSALVAIVSLQEGLKHQGSLGKFLRSNKQSYANLHGYAYSDVFPIDIVDEEVLVDPPKRKLQMLLSLMDKYHNLEWLLWLDGDDIITQPYESIENRVQGFIRMHEKNGHFCLSLVWVNDPMVSQDGALLIRNNPTGRDYLRKALSDSIEVRTAARSNSTYLDETIILHHGQHSLLESTIQDSSSRSESWKPGHWILHLPNHNYLQLLSTLKLVGEEMRLSPPSIFPPLERPSVDLLSELRRDRFAAVQGAIRHAWNGYADVCLQNSPTKPKRWLGPHIPCDDLSPLGTSGSQGHDWLFHAATLHDSIDTLAVAFGTDSVEYKEALHVILNTDLQATALRPTKTFEYSLRIVGGLLGAFSVTGDIRLLSRAKDAADALLQSPFAASPTVLPRMYDVLYPPHAGFEGILYKAYSRIYQWGRDAFTNEHHYNSLAGVGSFTLEFYFLSEILGLNMYRKVVDEIFRHVAHHNTDGTVPNHWNVMTGEPTTKAGGLGSGSDSFVEYLLKVPLYACGRERGGGVALTYSCRQYHPAVKEMLALFHKITSVSLPSKHIIQKEGNKSVVYPTDGSQYYQLLCFLPGLVALDSYAATSSPLQLAEEMVSGCGDMYKQSPSGLGPEEVPVNQKSKTPIGDRRYLLRPEYVESLFVMYRLTGKDEYQELGWRVFQSLEQYCKIDLGYTGLKDVYDPGGERIDDMPSYYLAETLKYLLLLFGPDDFLSLDSFVFTTEAHPMRRMKNNDNDMERVHTYIQTELEDGWFKVHIPLPWPLVGVMIFVILLMRMCAIILQKGFGILLSRYRSVPRSMQVQ